MIRTLLPVALLSFSALAEDLTPPPPPPPVRPPDTEVHTSRPADAPLEDEGGRVRWGISGNLGWHVPQSAFTIGAEGRVGYQFTNVLSLYATVGFTGGFGIGASGTVAAGRIDLTGLYYYYFGALAELMFGDLFYVAGGPVFASGALAGISGVSGGSSGQVTLTYADGVKPGIDLRLGLGLGRARPPSFRRGGFNIGLDALILFHPNSEVVRISGDGSGGRVEVTSRELSTTVTPMLMLGYDAR